MYSRGAQPDVWHVYLIQSMKDSSLYTGIALDVEARLHAHNQNRGARYTRGRGPWVLIASCAYGSKGEALRMENRLKRMRREAKLMWATGFQGRKE
jgi:putative endonuclease